MSHACIICVVSHACMDTQASYIQQHIQKRVTQCHIHALYAQRHTYAFHTRVRTWDIRYHIHALDAHCNTSQYTATHRNTLQHIATHCNTLPVLTAHSHQTIQKSNGKIGCRCEIFVALPTATATLRRPWKANIRTSGWKPKTWELAVLWGAGWCLLLVAGMRSFCLHQRNSSCALPSQHELDWGVGANNNGAQIQGFFRLWNANVFGSRCIVLILLESQNWFGVKFVSLAWYPIATLPRPHSNGICFERNVFSDAPSHIRKRALYINKRAMYIYTRALYF